MVMPVPDDVYVSEEERAYPIYQTGSAELTQGRGGRAPFQIVFLFFSKAVLFFRVLSQFQICGGATTGVQPP